MVYKLIIKDGFTIKHLPILGHGNQGTVFKNGNHATKVFSLSSSRPNDSDGKVATRISYLNLNSFVRPYNLIFRNGKLYSFDMDLLQLEKDKKITEMDVGDLIDNIKVIRKDVKKLSDEGIKICDLQTHNIGISNRKIWLFDFSDYSFSDDEHLLNYNNSEIDNLFGCFCIYEELSFIDPIKIYDYVYADYLRSNCESIEEYLTKNVLGKYKNVRDFVLSRTNEKQLVKRR